MTNENPFQTAKSSKRFLKIGIWGDSGTGKTNFALQAPKVCVIDTEGGTRAFEGMFPFSVIRSQNYLDLLNALTYLENEKHGFDTLVIDPGTVVYEVIQESRAVLKGRVQSGSAGDFDPVDWRHIKSIYKRIMIRIGNLSMNVIMTFREKELTDFSDMKNPKKLGPAMEGEKSSKYYFDVFGRMIKVKDKEGAKHIFQVEKARGVYSPLDGQKILIPETGAWEKVYNLAMKLVHEDKKLEGKGTSQALAGEQAPEEIADKAMETRQPPALPKPKPGSKEIIPEPEPTPADADPAFLMDRDNIDPIANENDYRDTHPTIVGQHESTVPNAPPPLSPEETERKAVGAEFKKVIPDQRERLKLMEIALSFEGLEMPEDPKELVALPFDIYKRAVQWCMDAHEDDTFRKTERVDEWWGLLLKIRKIFRNNPSLDSAKCYTDFMNQDCFTDDGRAEAAKKWNLLGVEGLIMFYDYMVEIEKMMPSTPSAVKPTPAPSPISAPKPKPVPRPKKV